MKKMKRTLMTAAAFAAALNFAGCHEDYQNVYGPPPDESVMTSETQTASETSAAEEQATETTAAESEGYSGTSEKMPTTEPPTPPPTTFEPTENVPAPVYGPPKFFGLF